MCKCNYSGIILGVIEKKRTVVSADEFLIAAVEHIKNLTKADGKIYVCKIINEDQGRLWCC